MSDALLTTDDVAKRLGISPYMVTAERKRGRLHHSKLGPRLVRFTEADVTAYTNLLSTEAAPGTKPVKRRGGRPAR